MVATVNHVRRKAVRQIVCLKLDHVGDLLIAAPALLLLRESFREAHITLLCGPWNAGLAHRLNVADDIRSIEYFSQNSAVETDAGIINERRRQARNEIIALALPPCDLAIDLRRDEDTRELLKLIDAHLYAGFGDQRTFSYLDVALPFTRHPPAAGATSIRLRPADLMNNAAHRIDETGLHLTGRRASIGVVIETDAAWSPADDGEDDSRVLGAALWRVDMPGRGSPDADDPDDQARPPVEIARTDMTFGPGWLNWEPWGRWTNAAAASFRINVSRTDPEVRLLIGVQGHTSASHPVAVVTVTAEGVAVEHVFRAGDEPVTLTLETQAVIAVPVARSLPFLMRGGRYRGELRVGVVDADAWEPLALTMLSGHLGQVLARVVLPQEFPGYRESRFPFEVELKDTGEPVIFRIEPVLPNHRAGIGILGLDLDWQQGKYPELPLVHMEQQILDLAAMVAQRYAAATKVPARGAAAARLTRTRRQSTALAGARRLDRRKHGWFGWASVRKRKLVGVGVGANKETKLWPVEHFVDLCRRILNERETDIVFIGGPAERDLVQEIVRELRSGARVLDMTASCAIMDLGELLARLDCYIGLDTGTTHFAGLVGLPTFAIFGASHDPIEWGPVGERSDWIASDIACAGCSFSRLAQCSVDVKCMSALSPADIWPAVQRMIVAGGPG